MKIIFHLGVHATDAEGLLRCLLKNRQLLANHRIAVPGPARYRNLIRSQIIADKSNPASAASQSALLQQMLDVETIERLILSWDGFLSLPPWAVSNSQFYPIAAERISALRNLFPDHDCEFCLALRNPAGFLSELQAMLSTKQREDFLAGTDVESLRWSEMIDRILERNRDITLSLWCDEDRPLIWPEVVQHVSGLAQGTPFLGADEPLSSLLRSKELRQLKTQLAAQTPMDAMAQREIICAYLQQNSQMQQTEIDLPGWTQTQVDRISRSYDADVSQIAARDDLCFIC
jgi:hypothetical protein